MGGCGVEWWDLLGGKGKTVDAGYCLTGFGVKSEVSDCKP